MLFWGHLKKFQKLKLWMIKNKGKWRPIILFQSIRLKFRMFSNELTTFSKCHTFFIDDTVQIKSVMLQQNVNPSLIFHSQQGLVYY